MVRAGSRLAWPRHDSLFASFSLPIRSFPPSLAFSTSESLRQSLQKPLITLNLSTANMGMLDEVLGAFRSKLIATIFTVFLGGVVACQTVTYYLSEHGKNDKLAYRFIVYGLFFIDLFHSAMCCHTIYVWSITSWGNPAGLVHMPWTFYVEPSIVGIVTIICQSFYAYRVYIVSGRRFLVPSVILLLSFISMGFGIGTTGFAVAINREFSRAGELLWVVTTWLLSSALADIVITTSLIYYLRKATRGDHQRSSTLVDRILRNTIETNGLTMVVAVLDTILYLIWSAKSFHLIFNFMLPKLLTMAVLVSLNSRGALAAASTAHGVSTLGSGPISRPSAFTHSQGADEKKNKPTPSYISFTKQQTVHTCSENGHSDHPFGRSDSTTTLSKEAIELEGGPTRPPRA
ncbi:hypothetical protein BCR35DRAFT_326072 [Leucosporidium creatinivorum]|uniref:DUF6534 domain-containing protein n=1 Tax=Leucosporidium creatinivorum TaxID=106004 RepID=A0A1Y2EQN4_9BASI|nr:hypothetical protein BCR35DRAFT_326072 [Leucosporidium creatinivorum]